MGGAKAAGAASKQASQSSAKSAPTGTGPAPGMFGGAPDQYAEAHSWKPISRSFLRASPLENSGVLLLSELPMPILHMEFDWAVKKKNVRQFIWSVIAIILMIVEIEMAFNSEKSQYEVKDTCEYIKMAISFVTVMQLYYVYDYYEYLAAGSKKEWYKMLYTGRNPGPAPTFSNYLTPFLAEFILLALHCPPYFDFRFWTDVTGGKKVFISDKMGVFVLLRVYTLVRVVRDYTQLFARRRLVYDSGYRDRGGKEIDAPVAIRANYRNYPGAMTALLAGVSIMALAYMTHCAERDWQPEKFTYMRCLWWVIFMTAAMDFDNMGVQSEFGKLIAVLVVSWGLVLLSMFVSVVFEVVNVSSYEGWAYSWMNQMGLLRKERDAASSVIAMWFKWLKARRQQDAALGKDSVLRNNMVGPDTAFAVNMVNKYKLLREIQFLLHRAEGSFEESAAESGVSISDKLAVLKNSTIGSGTGESQSIVQSNFDMRNRVRTLEENQNAILQKVSQLSAKYAAQ